MSFGRLAAGVVTTANTNQIIYTIPQTCMFGEVNLDILNPNVNDAIVNVALHTGTLPAAADFIEKGIVIPAAGGTLTRYGLIVSPNENISIQSDRIDVVMRISGQLKIEV